MKHVLLAIRLHDRQPQRRNPAHGAVRVCDLSVTALSRSHDRCDLVQPRHDGRGAFVRHADRSQRQSREIHRQRVQHIVIEVDFLIVTTRLHVRIPADSDVELAFDLLARAHEGHAVHRRHHGLLDDFAIDFFASTQQLGHRANRRVGVAKILMDSFLHDAENRGIHVSGLGTRDQIDLRSAGFVESQRGVMLQSVTASVLC